MFDLDVVQVHDLKLPANVFEAGYAGLREGITLSQDRGPDPLRPRQPAVNVGHRFVQRDHVVDRDRGPLGAVYHRQKDATAQLRRAVAHQVECHNGTYFWVLRRPLQDETGESLLRVSLQLPTGFKVKPVVGQDGREFALHVQRGVSTDGTVLAADQDELLIRLEDGQSLSIFFADGLVRQFAREKGKLTEILLDFEGMVEVRIADARRRLEKLELNDRLSDEERGKAQYRLLSGMVDLLHLPRAEPALREDLVKTFFFQLPDRQLAVVHRKLLAVLHQYDSVLALALSAPGQTTVVPLKGATANSDGAKAKAVALAKKRVRAEAERARRLELVGSNSGKGGGQKKGTGKK